MKYNEQYFEGENAYLCQYPLNDNPYPRHSVKWFSWKQGWVETSIADGQSIQKED